MKNNQKKQTDVSIILVNWNCGQVIINCIDSLIKTIKKHSYEVIVVDNASKDDSIKEIEHKFPKVKLIKNNFNNMFAGANNQGYKVSRGKFIFILNADTIATPNAIDKLLDYMKTGKEQAMTCTLLNKDETIQRNMHRGFPNFFRLITGLIYKRWGILNFLPSVKNYVKIDNKFDKDFYIEQAAGAAILLDRKLIQRLGYLFDEKSFPLFYNDVDLCYRINKLGIKILCKTNVKIYHIGRFSVKKVNFYNHWGSYCPSAIKYFKKIKSPLDFLFISFISKAVFSFLYFYSYYLHFIHKIDNKELSQRKTAISLIIKEPFNYWKE